MLSSAPHFSSLCPLPSLLCRHSRGPPLPCIPGCRERVLPPCSQGPFPRGMGPTFFPCPKCFPSHLLLLFTLFLTFRVLPILFLWLVSFSLKLFIISRPLDLSNASLFCIPAILGSYRLHGTSLFALASLLHCEPVGLIRVQLHLPSYRALVQQIFELAVLSPPRHPQVREAECGLRPSAAVHRLFSHDCLAKSAFVLQTRQAHSTLLSHDHQM